jgi:hypothetical protein
VTFQVQKSDMHGFMEIIQAFIPYRSRSEFWLCHFWPNLVILAKQFNFLNVSVFLCDLEMGTSWFREMWGDKMSTK